MMLHNVNTFIYGWRQGVFSLPYTENNVALPVLQYNNLSRPLMIHSMQDMLLHFFLVDFVIIKIVLNGWFSPCTGIRRYPDCS